MDEPGLNISMVSYFHEGSCQEHTEVENRLRNPPPLEEGGDNCTPTPVPRDQRDQVPTFETETRSFCSLNIKTDNETAIL